jgi:hypothetical protein
MCKTLAGTGAPFGSSWAKADTDAPRVAASIDALTRKTFALST